MIIILMATTTIFPKITTVPSPEGSLIPTIERKAKYDDNNKWDLSSSHDIATHNNKPENHADNNFHSNKTNPCADSEDNNDNNMDGYATSASTPILYTSPERNKNNATTARLPTFISHPSGTVLRVLNRKRLQRYTKRRVKQLKRVRHHTPLNFISRPTGIVLRVLNRKRSRRSTSPMETTTTDKQVAAQHIDGRVRRIKQRANWQHHYSHEHHRPPQQQYKSKNWTIAIILKLTLVA